MGDYKEALKKEQELQELFSKTVGSEEHRRAHAEAFGSVILDKLPEEVSVRRIYTIENVPLGTVPYYQIDLDYLPNAWYMPKNGSTPQNIVEVDEITVPTYAITAEVEWKMRDARVGRIDVVRRAQERFMDTIRAKEEEDGWALLKASVQAGRTLTVSGDTSLSGEVGLTKNVINAGFALMSSLRGYGVKQIWASPNSIADIRAWTQTDIDPVTQREIWTQAGLNVIWNAEINELYSLNDYEVYLVDNSPGHYIMPITFPLTTKPVTDREREWRDGIMGYEEIGFAVLDVNACVKIALNR